MKHACVVGQGISHSRSPVIHGFWIRKYGLDASYAICDVSPDRLPQIIEQVRVGELEGCNVTVPHKQAVAGLLDEIDQAALATGSINTVYRTCNGQVRGTSTDGQGYLAHLAQTWPDHEVKGSSTVVLGAGGAARSIIAALLEAGAAEIHVANRTSSRTQPLVLLDRVRVKPVTDEALADVAAHADLVVNTTSLGTGGKSEYPFPIEATPARCIISDIVYVPLETPMLSRARQLDRRTLDGLGMLLHQAVEGFRLWFGIKPEVTPELRRIVEQDILSSG